MQLHYLEEFVVFARYLNFTHAADELHMTQSSLSKHIKQLETETGINLLLHKNGKISLTQAGSHFLSTVPSILDNLQDALNECRNMSSFEPFDFLALQPLYADSSSIRYFSMLQDLYSLNPRAHVLYVNPSRNNLEWSLKNDKLHMIITYDYGNIDEIAEKYRQEGFACKPLAAEPLAIWVTRGSELDKPSVSVEDLDGATILIPNDSCFLMDKPITKICEQKGISPKIEIANTNSQAEFLSLQRPKGVYLYPKSLLSNSIVVQAITSRVVVPFSDQLEVHGIALAYPTGSEGSRLACTLLAQDKEDQ